MGREGIRTCSAKMIVIGIPRASAQDIDLEAAEHTHELTCFIDTLYCAMKAATCAFKYV